MKKTIIIIIVLLATLLIAKNTLYIQQNETLFNKNLNNSTPHIYEDFSTYELNSEIIDEKLENLSRWEKNGIITAWAEIENYKEIETVNLVLTDSNGNVARIKGIKNLNIPREKNKIKSDDLFEDYWFNCENQSLTKWEDFMLINGKNFLFWEWNKTLGLDMSKIVSITSESEVPLNDIVIHDGLCQNKNSLDGNWYSPNGLPQYGVWWVDRNRLLMKNIEIEQYPSNGDHVRILSKKGTPTNFILRTKFEITELGRDYSAAIPTLLRNKFLSINKKKNSYIRIAWDFDNEYDPGHDQTILYLSSQYNYFGLQRVFPIIRYFKQGYEPELSHKEAKRNVKLSKNSYYIVDVLTNGQHTKAEIYKKGLLGFRKLAEVEYEFNIDRPKKSYPISIESTGNIEIELDLVEVRELT